MANLLSIFALLISFLAILINQWVSLFPKLGISFQYHRRWAQLVIAILAIGLTFGLYWNDPTAGRLAVLIAVLLLTPLSGFNHASRMLIPVDAPVQAMAAEADWADDALVLGHVSAENSATAWLIETLIPHHLVNDVLGDQPILATW